MSRLVLSSRVPRLWAMRPSRHYLAPPSGGLSGPVSGVLSPVRFGSVRFGSVRFRSVLSSYQFRLLISIDPVSLELSLIRRLLSIKFRLIRLLITVSSGPVSGPVLCPVLSPVGSDPATRGRSDRLPVPRSPFVPRVAGASCGRIPRLAVGRIAFLILVSCLSGLLVICVCRCRAGFPVLGCQSGHAQSSPLRSAPVRCLVLSCPVESHDSGPCALPATVWRRSRGGPRSGPGGAVARRLGQVPAERSLDASVRSWRSGRSTPRSGPVSIYCWLVVSRQLSFG